MKRILLSTLCLSLTLLVAGCGGKDQLDPDSGKTDPTPDPTPSAEAPKYNPSKDKIILNELNNIPIMATHAHTRPFVCKWLNVVTGLILPLGVFFYFRMLRFRFRLFRDLKNMRQASDAIIARIDERFMTTY